MSRDIFVRRNPTLVREDPTRNVCKDGYGGGTIVTAFIAANTSKLKRCRRLTKSHEHNTTVDHVP